MMANEVLAVCVSFVFASGAATAELSVAIREWSVPTPDSRPHDPEVAPDGALWYTAQLANKLGRLDPKTGEIKEFPLRTPDSGPHGLAADRDGNIWFTANSKAYIGKLNPSTGEVSEYPMPDRRARDPHSLAFDPSGALWFTVQQGNFVGKLEPGTGKVTLKDVPTPNARPYGIIVTEKGVPFFCEFNSNKIGSINPASLEITEVRLPQGARPRRLARNPDGFIYYSDFARGFVGRLDPKSGKVIEWHSPGGASSRPYGIASTKDGMVWYSESGVTPNTVVAFNPRTKAFQSWPIPSGGGVVRNMVATPDDKLYLACSGVNKVGIVEMSHSTKPSAQAPGKETLRLRGQLVDGGVECQRFRASNGKYYTLVGDLKGLHNGDTVEIEGTIAEMSFCMQDTTVQVQKIAQVKSAP
jgi:virginiamycin B lyase